MNMILRMGTISRGLVAVLCIGGALGACTTQEAKSGTGGHGGTTGGTGGTTGSGGGSTGSAATDGVACLPPVNALITDFTYVANDAGVMDQVHFGDDTTTLSGGEFFYPNASSSSTYKLVSDVTGNKWHITGTVGDYSGFGLFFDSCNRVDASKYRGISFTISGTVQGSSVTFEVDTLNNIIRADWLNAHPATPGATVPATDPGRCTPAATATNQYAQSDCVPATKAVPVSATPTTVLWSDFTNGKPKAAVEPGDIIGIRWILPTPVGVGTATVATYPLDITIDDLTFVQ
jgi:hypothetical protein